MGTISRVLELGGRNERERMAARVERMAERLAEEEHTRARFIGKVSHELRTPLTVIKGYVYTLRRSEQDESKLAKLDVIEAECERLAYLVEDLLELSRSRAGELRVSDEAFPLRGCVEEVVERLRTVAEQRDVAVDVVWRADGELVRGDRNLSARSSRTCSRMESGMRRPRARSRSPLSVRPVSWRCRWTTAGEGSRSPTCRTSSTSSTRRPVAPNRAPASAWRSPVS